MSENTPAYTFRHIRDNEYQTVAGILQHYASQEILLWRNADDILAHKDSFFVVADATDILGCVAIHDYGNGLFELRSLAVEQHWQNRGLGSFMVEGVIDHCRKLHAKTLFALTRKVTFFERLGFIQEPTDNFPEKVWKDCQLCRKKNCCDETALAIRY